MLQCYGDCADSRAGLQREEAATQVSPTVNVCAQLMLAPSMLCCGQLMLLRHLRALFLSFFTALTSFCALLMLAHYMSCTMSGAISLRETFGTRQFFVVPDVSLCFLDGASDASGLLMLPHHF